MTKIMNMKRFHESTCEENFFQNDHIYYQWLNLFLNHKNASELIVSFLFLHFLHTMATRFTANMYKFSSNLNLVNIIRCKSLTVDIDTLNLTFVMKLLEMTFHLSAIFSFTNRWFQNIIQFTCNSWYFSVNEHRNIHISTCLKHNQNFLTKIPILLNIKYTTNSSFLSI